MCGIAGIISKTYLASIEACTEMIAHRGPDDFGYFKNDVVAFGHRRLAIQDLSENGHQPMFTADGRYCIVFNGEIYNHWEIRETLKDEYTFMSSSDTETILYAYLKYGKSLFSQLNGIFAFIIYDTHTHDIVMVRDHFGVKPFYYYQNKNIFAFSSEIKSLTILPEFDDSIDIKAINNYIHFLYSPAERTPFQQVKKLLPGHYIEFNALQYVDGLCSIAHHKFYEIPFKGEYSSKTEAQLTDELDERLLTAVKRQLLSDVPVGFFLSGGLDSSAVVAMAKKILGDKKRLKCYTINSGNTKDNDGFADDLYYAKVVAKYLDVDLEIVEGASDMMKDFDKMIYHLDEPQADLAPIHVLNICRKAREDGHIVLLGGTAGDDLFSGYRRHQALRYEKYFQWIPKSIGIMIKNCLNLIPSQSGMMRRIKKIVHNLEYTKLDRMAGYYGWIEESQSKVLFKEPFKSVLKKYEPKAILVDSLKNIDKERADLNKMLYWDMKYFLTDHNLNYTDKLSMAVSVEVRVPFLDIELVEFSTRIPPELKLRGVTTKYLLKKVMEKYLPHEVIYRPKTGFGSPLRYWILNDLKLFIEQKLFNHDTLFDLHKVKQLLKNNQEGKIDASYTILSLLSINSWIKQFRKV